MQNAATRSSFAVLLVVAIAAFVWLKKYSFVPHVLTLRFFYLTLGLSYIFFRVLHLIIDAWQSSLAERVSAVSYLNYTLNFTTLISGPIQRYRDFAAMQLAPDPLPLKVRIAGRAVERIIAGFFKVNVLSLVLSEMQHSAITAIASPLPFGARVSQAILIIAVYPVYLYCNFSGYIDIVIGMARFLRIELPENFDRPFESDNAMNFWGRWHITLSLWLKTYVYNNLLLAMMRRYRQPGLEPFLGVFAFFVTFFLVGVWHGQTSEFIFFGVLTGGGVSGAKLYQVLMAKMLGRNRYRALSKNVVYNALARGLNFAWFAFTLLWFWSSWTQLADILKRVGAGPVAIALLVIFLGAAVLLEAWERVRALGLAWSWNQQPILLSRYTRTAWSTTLAVISAAVLLLLNTPAPDIVYKGF
jgi:D-alanyl-lipoteichoic acid acyltransferase DltB (MBOAT superfamily)